jgi:hypothetical protein
LFENYRIIKNYLTMVWSYKANNDIFKKEILSHM